MSNIPTETTVKKSLAGQNNRLADTLVQLQVLNGNHPANQKQFAPVEQKMCEAGLYPLLPTGVEILQVNVGKRCNQTCAHCHVDAGPDRREAMSMETMQQCLNVLAQNPRVTTLDITGGAPEMHPLFKWLAEEATKLGKKVIDRCNLTIITANSQYRQLPQFFAANGIEVVSSLPHFGALHTNRQRGNGVFEASVEALQLLNEVGYGQEGSGLVLNLVYNPSGAFLPGSQQNLETEFKRQLHRKYGIVFNRLFAITNMPISRYLHFLLQSGQYEPYMQLLIDNFNPAAAKGVMCRNTISVSWEGFLYDCDFNQMLNLQVSAGAPQHISNFNLQQLNERQIVLNQHCYGCTAGSGSGCGGATA
ncbi:DUF3641 domain-containing protein [Sphingobacteriales bacterium UPWRP_1]|nr:radical SAM protein [Sphingobacteriales bacterium TSM_CSM]PSJ79136.1 DUF3641 domain-containing protein [Sphingobacteriales bacterium UPWRP_1]